MRALLLTLFFITTSAYSEPTEVFWEDLVPANYVAPPVDIDHALTTGQQNLSAPVVTKFNNMEVKIPGFVVPLEGDQDNITEFLLVPFFGACIHVPPPPPNQIVYVKIPEGVPAMALTDVVWVVGTLTTEGWSGEIATVGYTLKGQSVLPYDG
ncbi:MULTISPECIES: DUF3299 domain-containing protein [Aliiglaciecola]|uniref:DUF3299 domain-containing protein n=1 Tax=Aliiglaciecola TaxID=1406885 RepID=UPI001C0A3315|nr:MULTISPECIES: DUF3299 domain-containing protein [Aliiglaciecola]MBU2880237.1 DUF3299 domain-containing protein [Aliiglaciecola lipolytica]MDO6712661.1 DUF3299 domain-containing protein [Aliiglaciecola sp. 2_MG-2023]MDO6754396.1 DUF3299 domain-containing protein [Aliiglaciecola sp. 1_MG-2023]